MPAKTGKSHPQWTGVGEISGHYFAHIKRGSLPSRRLSTRNTEIHLEFNLTKEYLWNLFLKQERKCSLSGIDLVINYGRKLGPEHTASLDRIDNKKGYVKGNVQWVHKHINLMKNILDNEYFISLCKKVAKTNEGE